MSSQSFFHWFAPPEYARTDLRRPARALWIVSWPFFAVVTVLLGIVVLAIGLALVLHALVTLGARREGLDVDAVELLVADMRSPMQVLISRLEVLRAELRGESAKDAEAALRSVRTLRRLTNSVLDVS